MKITAVSKLKHSALREAVKKFGTAKKLAEHLGVSHQLLYQWINLRSTPLPLNPIYQWRTPEELAALEEKLFALTGQTLEELFPVELRAAKELFLRPSEIESTKEVSVEALSLGSPEGKKALSISYESDFDSNLAKEDREAAIQDALRFLSFREKEVIKLRYGLGGHDPHTLKETAHVFRVTRERVRQIETKALTKLRQPSRSQNLIGHWD